MSTSTVSADLQAAAYWKNVALSDKAEFGEAVTKVAELTADARREEQQPIEERRRVRGLGSS